jgi:hypothetical protein
MAGFERSYPSEKSPEELWRLINTPLLDPDMAKLVHEDMTVSYTGLEDGGRRIGLGTRITYVPTDKGRRKVDPIYRRAIPRDVDLYVSRMPSDEDIPELLRHDVLDSDKGEGSVTRTVRPEGDGSILVVAATLSINGIGNMFDDRIEQALAHVFGGPAERTLALAQDILAA